MGKKKYVMTVPPSLVKEPVADRETMLVSFDGEKCIACELCVSLCPYGAMEAHF